MKRIVLIAVAIVLIVWVVGCGCYPFVQWSPLNCSNQDVDINTGRFRHQRYLVWICINERIEESLLSRTLDPAETSPIWQRCTTVSPFVNYSPNYHFGAAPSQVKSLGMIWDAATFSLEAQKQICKSVLYLWQTGQYAGAADEYIESLDALVRSHKQRPWPYTVNELPKPRVPQ
jgi:hypothetical protein